MVSMRRVQFSVRTGIANEIAGLCEGNAILNFVKRAWWAGTRDERATRGARIPRISREQLPYSGEVKCAMRIHAAVLNQTG